MMEKISVAVIDKETESIIKTKSLLQNFSNVEIIQTSENLNDFELILRERLPVIIVIGPVYALGDIENLLTKYSHSLGRVKIILLTEKINAGVLKEALKLNIHDVMEFPFTFADFDESIKRAKVMQENILTVKNENEQKKIKKEKTGAKKITIFGTKGGCGKSFIAINLAAVLMKKLNKNISIFDLNYQFGDVALMLNLFPKNTIYDILPVIDQLDSEMLSSFLTKHESGVSVLPAPIDPTQDEALDTKVTKKVLGILSGISDYIIIDTPAGFTDNVLFLLEETDCLCTVASMDVPSIKNLKITLQLLEQLRFPSEKILLVLNRSDSKVGITREEIMKTINKKIDIFIPSSKVVPMSVNKGNPVVFDFPRSPVSGSIVKLAETIINKLAKTG